MRYTALALSLAMAGGCLSVTGCDREVSHQEKTTVKDDGTVKKEEKTVTEKPDGTIVKEEKHEVNKP